MLSSSFTSQVLRLGKFLHLRDRGITYAVCELTAALLTWIRVFLQSSKRKSPLVVRDLILYDFFDASRNPLLLRGCHQGNLGKICRLKQLTLPLHLVVRPTDSVRSRCCRRWSNCLSWIRLSSVPLAWDAFEAMVQHRLKGIKPKWRSNWGHW